MPRGRLWTQADFSIWFHARSVNRTSVFHHKHKLHAHMIRIRFRWPLPSSHCLKAITRHKYPSEPVSHKRNTISSNAAWTNTFTYSQSSRYAEVEWLLEHYQLLMSVRDHTLTCLEPILESTLSSLCPFQDLFLKLIGPWGSRPQCWGSRIGSIRRPFGLKPAQHMTSGVSVCSTHEALMKKSAFHYDTEPPDLMSDTFYTIFYKIL